MTGSVELFLLEMEAANRAAAAKGDAASVDQAAAAAKIDDADAATDRCNSLVEIVVDDDALDVEAAVAAVPVVVAAATPVVAAAAATYVAVSSPDLCRENPL